MAVIKALVPVAWADGTFAEREKQMLEALLDAYGATDDDKTHLRTYAAEKKTLDDIALQDLSAEDRRLVLSQAVLLSFVDGDQGKEELDFLHALATRLRIPEGETKTLLTDGVARAQKFLALL